MSLISRNLSVGAILDTAWAIFVESGIENVNIASVASRLDVDESVVTAYFIDDHEVLTALVDRTYRSHFQDDDLASSKEMAVEQLDLARLRLIIKLPSAVRSVVNAAFFTDTSDKPELVALRQKISRLIEANWIMPLTQSGMDLGRATADVYIMVSSTLQLCSLLDLGVITPADMETELTKIVRAVARDSTSPSSMRAAAEKYSAGRIDVSQLRPFEPSASYYCAN